MLLKMLWAFFQIGLFTIGGGYAMIPLITEEMISNGWMTAAEISDIIAIAKMTPGPFAVNAATFAGMKVIGIGGAIFCTFGVALPSLIITYIVARFFFNFQEHKIVKGVLSGIRPTVVALIASAIVTVSSITLFKIDNLSEIFSAVKNVEPFSIIILIMSLILLLYKKMHPVFVIILSGIAGIVFYIFLPNIL